MYIKNFIVKHKIYFIIGIIMVLFITISSINKNSKTNDPIVVDAKENDNNQVNDNEVIIDTITVDIKGAVKNPGVYEVVNGANVNDVIEMAGGLKNNGTTTNINLSKKVTDEMVIYIYTKSEYKKANSNDLNKLSGVCQVSKDTADISSCLSNNSNSIITNDSTVSNDGDDSPNNALININTASKAELLTLPGIGESKADGIIAYRQDKGTFKSIEEIKNVSGIGDALFDKIKNFIIV